MSIPVLDLKKQYAALEPELTAAMQNVMQSTQFVLGPVVKNFEQRVADYCRCDYGIGVASGTARSKSSACSNSSLERS